MKKILAVLLMVLLFTVPVLAADVTLEWDASQGATGYKLHYGQETGSYAKAVDVKNVTTYTVSGLSAGGWFFAATAYNDYGESDYSNEANTGFKPDAPVIRIVLNITVDVK